jgi:hypothetical protein
MTGSARKLDNSPVTFLNRHREAALAALAIQEQHRRLGSIASLRSQ